jgi:predicted adenylyl cyclase CyaB
VVVEIEAKFKLSPVLRRSLEAMLGSPIACKRQADFYFDVGALPVALRMRRDGDAGYVTLKSAMTKEAGIRVREEFEPSISPTDWDTWLTLFARLGFASNEQVNKTRTVYEFQGTCVVIDDVDDLGDYCEVEVVSDTIGDALQRLEIAITNLGLANELRLTDSYRDLLRFAATTQASSRCVEDASKEKSGESRL